MKGFGCIIIAGFAVFVFVFGGIIEDTRIISKEDIYWKVKDEGIALDNRYGARGV